jgi:predicted TIM-barrel fold metal-dependent hydrolase
LTDVLTGSNAESASSGADEPYLVVSTDSHVGPSLEHDLRPYCPPEYLDDFDAFAKVTAEKTQKVIERFDQQLREGRSDEESGRQLGLEAWERTKGCVGAVDPHARLADMDASGVAVEVIFAGGERHDVLPFADTGFSGAGPADVAPELRAVGWHIFNQWMADFASLAPERLLGVMQIPIWDVQGAIKEIQWGREAGLRGVNLPAPRSDFPDYTDPCYEPLWDACEDLEIPLLTHAAGGERPLGVNGRYGELLKLYETHWLGRRGLWELIFSGVFERHPRLKFVLTEQRAGWVAETLRDLDSLYENVMSMRRAPSGTVVPAVNLLLDDLDLGSVMPRRPSEYWASNCYVNGSTLAPFEIALRYDIGVGNLMWGTDYPHIEGTWPETLLSLRHTFASIPEEETRRILGETAVDVYKLDRSILGPVAQRIGPKPSDLVPLTEDEYPEVRTYAFRELGPYS